MDKKDILYNLKKVNKYIDYKIGDWVETCNMLPGIVQEIHNYYDPRKNMQCFVEDVIIYYPHYAIDNPDYHGGSSCSITGCGVHQISQEYVKILFSLGYDKLVNLWNDYKLKDDEISWDDFVKKEYDKLSDEEKLNGIILFNIGEEYSRKIKDIK